MADVPMGVMADVKEVAVTVAILLVKEVARMDVEEVARMDVKEVAHPAVKLLVHIHVIRIASKCVPLMVGVPARVVAHVQLAAGELVVVLVPITANIIWDNNQKVYELCSTNTSQTS